MKKIKVSFEIEIDDAEVTKIEDKKNDYKPLTIDKYIEGIELASPDDYYNCPRLINPIEEYFNNYIGDSTAMKSCKLLSIEEI